jgi:O-antigen ligase
VVVALGVVAIRGSDLDAFARFLGATPGKVQTPDTKVQTYSHRTLLAWLGWEIWKDDPVLGVGWEGSAEPANFEPHLAAAHERFPDEAPLAFPSAAPDRRYGVQNSWIQALADLGVVGFALWVAVFAVAAWLAARPALNGSPTALYGLLAVAVLVWLWTAQGFVAGIPLDAFTWLALGLCAASVPGRKFSGLSGDRLGVRGKDAGSPDSGGYRGDRGRGHGRRDAAGKLPNFRPGALGTRAA